ncbi:MAG TPA: hypothetical protein VN894_14605 [Polyangiaceae bacterium]|nr:hypothetical protein [Polyangiaceae bacterium]
MKRSVGLVYADIRVGSPADSSAPLLGVVSELSCTPAFAGAGSLVPADATAGAARDPLMSADADVHHRTEATAAPITIGLADAVEH